jgi:hypothetical protein
MVTTLIGLIVILAVGIALAGSIQGWQTSYDRVYSSVNTDSYTAKRAFDAVIRKSCRQRYLLDPSGQWLEVYYYASGTSTSADRYARFKLEGDKLMLYLGPEPLSTVTICSNVTGCNFKVDGRSVQMLLKLDSGTQTGQPRQTATVVTSAVLHNP